GYVSSMIRMSVLLVLWAITIVILCITSDPEVKKMMVVLLPNEVVLKKAHVPHDVIHIELKGPINKVYTDKMLKKDSPSIDVRLEWRDDTREKIFVRSPTWKVYMSENEKEYLKVSKTLKVIHSSIDVLKKQNSVSPTDVPYGYPESDPISASEWAGALSLVTMESHCDFPVGLLMVLDNGPERTELGLLYTIILITILYALIISEYIDRRFASMFVCIGALTLLTLSGEKPTFDTVVGWIDFETLMVLLSSMIMVALMWQTGFFDYITLVAYRTSMGHGWLLIYLLCMIAAFLAAILDNATVVLLLTPATIKLCEAAYLNTKVVLIILAIYAHMGGSMTPMGAPPNILIFNHLARDNTVNFTFFTAHMLPASVICMLTVFGLIFLSVGGRIYKVDEIQKARRIALKKPTDEILNHMEELKKRRHWLKPVPDYYDILATVQANQVRVNLVMLSNFGVAFLFMLGGFILRSVPLTIPNASFGWISMQAAFLLLILANQPNISPLLARIEWGFLLYVTSLFIITEIIVELGFISWLGQLTTKAVLSGDHKQQTISSMLIILWLSALCSAFLDNTAVAGVFFKVCVEVEQSGDIVVPIMSLTWALLLGVNYGGIGTMLGAISNEFVVVVAGENGYKISFMDFFYMGFPIMIFTLIVCSLYLLAAQVAIELI
ncbi:hypothetical protein KR038_011587, partial [Drosophila bunnanda]